MIFPARKYLSLLSQCIYYRVWRSFLLTYQAHIRTSGWETNLSLIIFNHVVNTETEIQMENRKEKVKCKLSYP